MPICDINDFFLYIQVLGGLRLFPHPICVGLETRSDSSYGQTGSNWQGKRRYLFQYTFSGEGVFQHAGQTHTIGACTGFLTASHDPQSVYGYPADKEAPWRFLFFDFWGQAACSMARDLIRRHGPLYELPPRHPVIKRLLAFHVYDQAGCAISALEGSRLVMDLLHALLSSKEDNPDLKTDNALVRRIHDHIQTHLTHPISVMDIASHFGVSREHLTRVFTEHGGMTPYQYIQETKIKMACSLLRTNVLSVKEISGKIGFDNVPHFVRAFKRIMHCTPTEYRHLRVLPTANRLTTQGT